ncbi:hypothetical protein [Streptomyces fractus]|uniref:hypothetical protein n=1 Tax=Streptomyces fractus TaxID=641806 RepID=UPI003CFB6DC2
MLDPGYFEIDIPLEHVDWAQTHAFGDDIFGLGTVTEGEHEGRPVAVLRTDRGTRIYVGESQAYAKEARDALLAIYLEGGDAPADLELGDGEWKIYRASDSSAYLVKWDPDEGSSIEAGTYSELALAAAGQLAGRFQLGDHEDEDADIGEDDEDYGDAELREGCRAEVGALLRSLQAQGLIREGRSTKAARGKSAVARELEITTARLESILAGHAWS